ncbi:MAG: biopolymer transporter ExbD [Blastochloris sp.]|nr:biopolymer transporter ExbD [Blastochloris sp.]
MIIRKREEEQAEISMSPMIDMVFLLLVFFLVSAKPIKPEADVGLSLPGTVAQEEVLELPDEQRINILADGQIILNDQPMDSPTSKDLPTLLFTLKRFKETVEANQAEALITIDAVDEANHQRIVDVMNTCAQAGIKGITFATNEESEDL